MSKNIFEKLGKKIDIFLENSEKDIDGLKKKAEEFIKETEEYIESAKKDIEPIINDISQNFKNEVPKEKQFIIKMKGNGKYKVNFSSKDAAIIITRKGSKKEFAIPLNKDSITNKKIENIINNAVINKEEGSISIKIKTDLLFSKVI
jgi:hypothetical protein